MKLVGRAYFNPQVNHDLGIRRGQRILALVVDADSEQAFVEELKTIVRVQHDRFMEALLKWDQTPPAERTTKPEYVDTMVDLDLTLKVHYTGRSVESNRLWWALLAIEASWINGTPLYRDSYWSKKLPAEIITPEMIHADELETHCEKHTMDVSEKDAWAYRRMEVDGIGRVHHMEPLGAGKVRLHIWRTTRFLNTKEFSDWIKRKIDSIMREGSLLKTDIPEFLMLKNNFLDMVKGTKKEN